MIALIALTFATAVALFFVNREPSGTILSMRAAPGARAVLLRRGFEARDTVFAALYDARGRHVWSEALFGAQPGGVPLVVGESVVVPGRDPDGRPATHVFRLGDGAFVFRAEPPPASVPSTARARYAIAAGRLFELYPGEPGSLSGYELGSGQRVHAGGAPEGAEGLDSVGSIIVVAGAEPSAFDGASLAPVPVPGRPAREPTRARSLSLAGRCVTWESASGLASVEASALGAGEAVVVEGEDASVLRIGGRRDQIVLASVDREGTLHVARVRSTEGPIADSHPEHVGPDAFFLRTDRLVIGLRLPELSAAHDAAGDFEVSAAPRAPTGCGSDTTR